MKYALVTSLLAAAVVFGNALSAPATLGKAPAFTLTSSAGPSVSLDQFEGKYVVLEWWNKDCPVVKRHYNGNIQGLQKQFTKDGVVWLSILSSAPGKQGYLVGEAATDAMKSKEGSPSHILLDADGKVGKLYNAKTTPQMVLISPKGEMLYNGAIDNMPNGNAETMSKAENYLVRAYNEAKAGKEVSIKTSQPYGCGVKY